MPRACHPFCKQVVMPFKMTDSQDTITVMSTNVLTQEPLLAVILNPPVDGGSSGWQAHLGMPLQIQS